MRVFPLKKSKYWYLYALMAAFLLLKMVRGVYGEASSGGGIWNVIQILFVLIGIVFLFSRYGQGNRVISIFLFFSFWLMFVSILNLGRHPITSLSSWFYFFSAPCAPLVLLLFYCVTKNNDIHDYSLLIKATYYVLIVLFYRSMTSYRILDSDEFIAFSDIYYPMCLLPLVLLQTKSRWSFVPLLSIVAGVFVSGKRGGLVVVALIALVYYFVGEKRRKTSNVLMLLLLVGLFVVSYFLMDYIDSNFGLHTYDRMMNSMDDGGSGRITRWGKTLSAISLSGCWELLFGQGFGAVYDLVGGRAHNDFIEVFYNYGFIAVILYIAFYVRLVAVNIKQYRCHYPYAKYMTCSIIVALVLAMVSFFIVEPTYVLASMFVTGLLLGDWTKFSNNGYQTN